MKKYLIILSTFVTLLIMGSCNEDAFKDDFTAADASAPTNLVYSEILNAREFASLKTGAPTIDTDGLIPVYEIVSGRTEDGTVLDATYMDAVSIENATEEVKNLRPENYYEVNGETVTTYISTNSGNNGIITIADGNKFSIGNYYFTIKATTFAGERELTTIFEDALKIGVGPELVTNLLYSPLAQNLVVGAGATTTKPFLLNGNADVTFSLGSDTDKLTIDSQTGAISLRSDYVLQSDRVDIMPTVQVTSNISGETTTFQGESFFFIAITSTPIILPKQTKYFFYPTLESENKTFGYTVDVIEPGNTNGPLWQQQAPSPLANSDSSLPVVNGKRSIRTGLFSNNQTVPHESDVIINSQDLSLFRLGFDLSTVFYIRNQFVSYMEDGRTPTDLEIYISTDYNGDNASATWTQINDQVACQIDSLTDTPFIGTPYPGNQNGPDPDGRKNSSRNANNKWVRCEFDLNPFKEEKNFTLKFKLASYFEGVLLASQGRGGGYTISDVYFQATEQ